MKHLVFVLGVFLFFVVASLPIGCQYVLSTGPAWLVTKTSMPNVHAAQDDKDQYIVCDSAAVKSVTGILLVGTAIASLACFAVACEKDSA